MISVTMVRDGKVNGVSQSVTQTRLFEYWPNGKLKATTYPENGRTEYYYNSNGRLEEKRDAGGSKILHEYDGNRRLKVVRRQPAGWASDDPTQRTTYHYDTNPFDSELSIETNGRLAAVEHATFKEHYTYDAPGSMLKKRIEGAIDTFPFDLASEYTYDAEGRLATLKYPNEGKTYRYEYDPMGRSSRLAHDDPGAPNITDATMAYNVAGLVSSFAGQTYTYNNRLQLTRITATNLNLEYIYPRCERRSNRPHEEPRFRRRSRLSIRLTRSADLSDGSDRRDADLESDLQL